MIFCTIGDKIEYDGKTKLLRKEEIMNKTQLIDVVAKEANLKKKDAEAAVNAVLAAIGNALVDGDKIQLVGFGSFEVKERRLILVTPSTSSASSSPNIFFISSTVASVSSTTS